MRFERLLWATKLKVHDTFSLFGGKNLVNTPTCFKGECDKLIDLMVTTVPKRIQNVTVVDCDLSDFHIMVLWARKLKAPIRKKNIFSYGSYKHFNVDKYQDDLSKIPFHVSDIFDSVDDAYWLCDELLINVINEHAPVKTRRVKYNQVPYMNDALWKAINARNMFKCKYYKCKCQTNWMNYKNSFTRNSFLAKNKHNKRESVNSLLYHTLDIHP